MIKLTNLLKESDHEVSMAQSLLDQVIKDANELKQKIGTEERDLPGWIQDHITRGESYIHQANKAFHEIKSEEKENLEERKFVFHYDDGKGRFAHQIKAFRLKDALKKFIEMYNIPKSKWDEIDYRAHKGILKFIDEKADRNYKEEYKKFQSSKKMKKYRAELNKYNRKKGTYGNGDGKDASHKNGKIVGFESESKNRGRREKSRLKKK